MFNKIKKDLYIKRLQLLFRKGIIDGLIIPFDDDFYEKMSHTYISALPVSIHIKYLKSKIPPGRCYDRSLYMFMCFDNALLVRGDNKDLELRHSKEHAGHGWIEMDNWVYDPSLCIKVDKDLYYKMYLPTNVTKCSRKEYESQVPYEYIATKNIEDFKRNGKKRTDLVAIIPLIMEAAKQSDDKDFISDLNDYLSLIKYDEEEIIAELDEKVFATIKGKVKEKTK